MEILFFLYKPTGLYGDTDWVWEVYDAVSSGPIASGSHWDKKQAVIDAKIRRDFWENYFENEI